MPKKIRSIFEIECGRKKGKRIFYAWENKRKGCNPKKELLLGMKAESEHSHLFKKGKRKIMAKGIAKDHIKEFPCYYSRGIIPLERKLNKRKLR